MIFKKNRLNLAVMLALPVLLSACNGDDGADGQPGATGSPGAEGATSLVVQTQLFSGNEACFNGGVQFDSGVDANGDGVLSSDEIAQTTFSCTPTVVNEFENFVRVATFPVCLQEDVSCNTDIETVAEIVAVSADGTTLIYTDSAQNRAGFVDINDPANPQPAGVVELPGEPTSVTVIGPYALLAVNTSADFVNVSGSVEVIDIASRAIVRSLDVGGQPDSIARSPDGNFAAVVIENERDEELVVNGEEGGLPQAPAGTMFTIDTSGDVADWTVTEVVLTGLADIAPDDPEPEYVDINADNIAVVTFQENNHIVLVDLETNSILNSFNAGTVNLTQIDTQEDGVISQTDSLPGSVREPDGVTWLGTNYFATANEGDFQDGARGFTIFSVEGEVVFEAGNTIDHLTARIGHYPDERSGNRGNEPENAEFGVYGDERFLFINSERSSLTLVYDVADYTHPVFKQVLPASLEPEGALAIPSRNLFVTASEADARDDGVRSSLNIFQYNTQPSAYPTINSVNRLDGTPIPFAALSGLAASPTDANTLYTVEDSFFNSNRILELDVTSFPARLTREIAITDPNGVFASLDVVALADPSVDDDDPSRVNVFDEADLADLINTDGTVNIDPEGIAVATQGGFWVVSEGSGTFDDTGRPINSRNLIFRTDTNGVIQTVIRLPAEVDAIQRRFGFEGVAEADGQLVVAFQREWGGEPNVRLGIYDLSAQTWSFLMYPLDAVQSQNGGWVGLSDISALGNGQFLVLERDNQSNLDAAVKRIYQIDISGLADGGLVAKRLVRDILSDVTQTHLTFEKIEGLAVSTNGQVYIVNDNDGVDDNSGETQLINLGNILN